jgi:hypothetical protein
MEDQIIKEVIDACMNMSEPERTEYLKKHFVITRRPEVKKRLLRDPQIPGAYKEYDVKE